MKVIRPTALETDSFRVGDKIEVPLRLHTFTATCQEVKDGKALFFFDDVVDERPMNKRSTNEGGFEKSDLKAWIDKWVQPALQNIFGDRLQEVTIPTVEQVFGPDDRYEDLGGEQLPLQKIRQNRVCSTAEGDWCWYWLQNKRESSSAYFAGVYGNGNCGYNNASGSYGVRPAFALTDQ